MVKPASYLGWIPSNDPLKITEPSLARKASGYTGPLDKITFQAFNWIVNTSSQWIAYFETTTDTLITSTASLETEKLDAPGSAGTANQILGKNNANNNVEWKSILGTAPIQVVHSANVVTLSSVAAGIATAGHVTIGTQTFKGDKTFADNLTITGSLTVSGTLTYLNTDNLQVEDKNIQLNYGSNTASAVGAGLEVLGDSNAVIATLLYDSTLRSKWKIGALAAEKEITVSGEIIDADIKATAAIAGSKLQAASSTLTGTVSREQSNTFTGNWAAHTGGAISFTSGTVKCYRVGNLVTVTVINLTFTSGVGTGGVNSGTSSIPTGFRPTNTNGLTILLDTPLDAIKSVAGQSIVTALYVDPSGFMIINHRLATSGVTQVFKDSTAYVLNATISYVV